MAKREELERIRKLNGEDRTKEELQLLMNNPDSNAAFFVDYWDENIPNLYHWKATLLGPIGAMFETGYFNLEVIFPSDYPNQKPSINFKTKCFIVILIKILEIFV